jgi:hypothetical protein
MDLFVERTDGKRIEYHRAERSRFVIDFVENRRRDTAIYYPEDFKKIEVGKRQENCAAPESGIDAVIKVVDRTITVSKSYETAHLREYYERDMTALRSMLAELKDKGGADDVA